MEKGTLGDPLLKFLGYYWLQKANLLIVFSKLIAREAQEVSKPTTKTNIHINL